MPEARRIPVPHGDFGRSWSLDVALRRAGGGPILRREPVLEADLAGARSELWLNGFLRRGRPDTPLDAVQTRLAPLYLPERCAGFALRAEGPGGAEGGVHAFGVDALAPVAGRAAGRLLLEGVLRDGERYTYALHAQTGSPPGLGSGTGQTGLAGASPPGEGVRVRLRSTALEYRRLELAAALEPARAVGEISDEPFAVVFTERAHCNADRYASRGALRRPPVESGGVLLGELCHCPASGECWVLVREVLEVHDATQQEFALIYTSATWKRVEAVLARGGAAGGSWRRRLVGQCHGHNFALEGKPCDQCARAAVCGRSTVFVSTADREFMSAVFARQPWALSWIAGSTLRGERVAKLYTWSGGVLRERGYHVVDEDRLALGNS